MLQLGAVSSSSCSFWTSVFSLLLLEESHSFWLKFSEPFFSGTSAKSRITFRFLFWNCGLFLTLGPKKNHFQVAILELWFIHALPVDLSAESPSGCCSGTVVYSGTSSRSISRITFRLTTRSFLALPPSVESSDCCSGIVTFSNTSTESRIMFRLGILELWHFWYFHRKQNHILVAYPGNCCLFCHFC